MIYGYARVSTKGQAKDGNSLEAQERALKEAGANEIYIDAFTGTKTDRPEFDKLMERIEEGDTLIVTKLDRFARSMMQGSIMLRHYCWHNDRICCTNDYWRYNFNNKCISIIQN